jgi:hypothetical protein
VPALPPSRRPGYAPEEVEELPDDAILEQDLRSAPAHEEIIELGHDAIVGEERGAHLPQPRTPVLQEYSSVVIADEALEASGAAFPRSDKTVVVRDRRVLQSVADASRRKISQARRRERALFVSAGLLAALLGTGVVVWLSSESNSTEDMSQEFPEDAVEPAEPIPAQDTSAEAPEQQAPVEPAAEEEQPEPPRLSIDQLPIAPKRKQPLTR